MTENPRWGFAQIVLVFAGMMLIGFCYSILGANVIKNLNEFESFSVSFLIQFFSTVILVYFLAVYLPKGNWRDVGLTYKTSADFLKFGVGGGLALFVCVMLMSIPLKYFQPELPPQYFEQVLRGTGNVPQFLVIMAAGSVLGPFSEELFYRGMIYPVFRKHLGPVWGAIISGILFGAIHWDLWRAIPLAIGGIGLCWLYEKTRSILVTTVAHGVWNAIMCLLVFFSLQ